MHSFYWEVLELVRRLSLSGWVSDAFDQQATQEWEQRTERTRDEAAKRHADCASSLAHDKLVC